MRIYDDHPSPMDWNEDMQRQILMKMYDLTNKNSSWIKKILHTRIISVLKES